MAGQMETHFYNLIMKYDPQREDDAWEAAHNCTRAIQERAAAGAIVGAGAGAWFAPESEGLSILAGGALGGVAGAATGYKSASCAEVRYAVHEGVRRWREDVWSQIEHLMNADREFFQ